MRRNVIASVKPLHSLQIVQLLARGQSLLPVHRLILRAHIIHHGNFWRYFALACPSFLQKGLDLRLVLCDVEIVNMLNPVYIKLRWVVKIVRKRKLSLLDLYQAGCSSTRNHFSG